MPRALVVYESMWGNSERLAQAVADGVAEVMSVDLTDVAAAPTDLAEVALVIAGGPTHGHTMNRPETRRDARGHGALHGSIGIGLREWLDELPDERERGLAAFDTSVPTGLRLRRPPRASTCSTPTDRSHRVSSTRPAPGAGRWRPPCRRRVGTPTTGARGPVASTTPDPTSCRPTPCRPRPPARTP